MKPNNITKFKIAAYLLPLFIFSYLFVSTSSVSAHCPLCVAGAAFGVTLTRWLGIDDTITGIWIGALLGSISFWLFSWLLSKKYQWVEKYKTILKPAIYILVWGSTLWSFYKFQLIIRMTQIFGFDKLTFGMIVGGVAFYALDLIKIKHYFNYQKIVLSLGSMTILSLLMYILINFIV